MSQLMSLLLVREKFYHMSAAPQAPVCTSRTLSLSYLLYWLIWLPADLICRASLMLPEASPDVAHRRGGVRREDPIIKKVS